MAVLRVYVSASCAGCGVARALIAYVRLLRPQSQIELIDLDQPDTACPANVFGTPTYCLDERVIALGNPSAQDLLAALDRAAAYMRLHPQSSIEL